MLRFMGLKIRGVTEQLNLTEDLSWGPWSYPFEICASRKVEPQLPISGSFNLEFSSKM